MKSLVVVVAIVVMVVATFITRPMAPSSLSCEWNKKENGWFLVIKHCATEAGVPLPSTK
ncbi:MAG: hypothetical protein Q4D56_08025 [Bacteroides sp.]|nr:hypothetical protein [Bacteroides sp.]